jgi:hypothetical protein
MQTALRSCASIAIAFAMLSSAHAQQRPLKPPTQTVARTWPVSGAWGVVLLRLNDGPLGCLLTTGRNANGEQYIWGLRWRRENVAVYITDSNEEAVAGPSIQVYIDKVPLGTYQVNKRVAQDGFYNATAELPSAESDRVLSAINVGQDIQFVTSSFFYSEKLQGAPQALTSLKACASEANRLNAAKSR